MFAEGTKQYYLSAAPQCPYPDASVGDLLENADIDFAFIQFYNNYCSVSGQFNWDTWLTYAQTVSPNKNIKLFLGLPGSASAAGSGYISDTSLLESTIADIASSSSFGGIALWDASQAFSNELNGEPYVEILKNLLTSASQTATTTVATSKTSAASTSSASTSSASTSQKKTTQSTTSTQSKSKVTLSPTASSAIKTSITQTTKTLTSSTKTKSSLGTTTTESTLNSVAITSMKTTLSSQITSAALVTPQTTTTSIVSSAPIQTAITSTLSPATKSSSVVSLQTATTSTLSPTTTSTSSGSTSSGSTSSDSTARTLAKELNAQYAAGKLNGKSTCTEGEIACSADGKFAVCDHSAWVYMECASGTTCYAYDSGDSVYTQCNFSYLESNYF